MEPPLALSSLSTYTFSTDPTLPVAWPLFGSLSCMLGVQRLIRPYSLPLYVGLDSCL